MFNPHDYPHGTIIKAIGQSGLPVRTFSINHKSARFENMIGAASNDYLANDIDYEEFLCEWEVVSIENVDLSIMRNAMRDIDDRLEEWEKQT